MSQIGEGISHKLCNFEHIVHIVARHKNMYACFVRSDSRLIKKTKSCSFFSMNRANPKNMKFIYHREQRKTIFTF